MENKKTTVWELATSWNDGEMESFGTMLFWEEKDAREAFKEAVEQCVREDCVGMFSDPDKHIPAEGYGLEEDENLFFVWEEGYVSQNYEEIQLNEKEVF